MITWSCKHFNELSAAELYAILQLRNEVFVVEQNCVFQDADNKDQLSYHLMAWREDKLVAYTRLVPPGVSYEEASIGRVVNALTVRGSGIGRELMQRSINACKELFGNKTIRIGAQLYLKAFYASLGFVPTGGIYPEDGIDHIQMLLSS
ncbi:MAG: GNAT family N-acetyltransferase [Chitinophagaceae bacterium]